MKRINTIPLLVAGFSIVLLLNVILNYAAAYSQSVPWSQNQEIAQKPKPKPQSKPKDCFQIFSQADDLYLANKKTEAEKLYRQCKPAFGAEVAKPEKKLEPIDDIAQLPEAERLWDNALDGIDKKLDTKIYFNLLVLLQNYPNFIPAYLKLSDYCLEKPEVCQESAKSGDPKNAGEILERVTQIYPDNVDLLEKKLLAFNQEKLYLEASIAARQFAVIYEDNPDAPRFKQLADDYLKKFEDQLDEKLRGETIVAILASIGNVVLTGDPNQSISGVQLIVLLSKGENELGKETALAFANKYQEQGNLLDDQEVLDYIKSIAGKITPYMGRDFDYEYFVVKDDSLNAFALPGGKVFINTGAILNTNSEAELAGLLGHEIAHAAFSHGFQKITQSTLLTNLTQTIPVAQGISALALAKHSQGQEKQADILGNRVLASAGYAGDGLYNLMKTFTKLDPRVTTNILASHPAPAQRVRYLQKLIVDNGYNRYSYEGVKRHRQIQEIIKKQDK